MPSRPASTATHISAFPAYDKTRPRDPFIGQRRGEKLRILLVEDDASDALLTAVALDETHIHYDMQALTSGMEVVPYLRRLGAQGEPMPDLLMLDLSLPVMDGFEVLSQLAELAGCRLGYDPHFRRCIRSASARCRS